MTNTQKLPAGQGDVNYRVTACELNNIDAPWITVGFADRPDRDERFLYNGKWYIVKSSRKV